MASFMHCETTVGTEKRKQLVAVCLNAINYRHGTRGEITYLKHCAKRHIAWHRHVEETVVCLSNGHWMGE